MHRTARIFVALVTTGLLTLAFAVAAQTSPSDIASPTGQQTVEPENCDVDARLAFELAPQMTAVARDIQIFGGSEEATFCDDSLTGGTSGSCEDDGIAGGEIVCANGNTPRSINCSLPGGTGCPSGTKCKCSWSCNSAQVHPIE